MNPIHSYTDDSTLHAGIMRNRPISVVELERRRLTATAASLSKDLEAITAWGFKNMVEFNASKTQYCTLSNKRCSSEHSVLMNNEALPRSHSFKLLGLLGKSSDLFRARKYFSPSNLLTLYKAQVRPSLEYCSHIWGATAPTTLSILDAVQRRAIRPIGDPTLTCRLQPLSHHRAVGDLSLFYRYLKGFCSFELTSIIPPLSKPASSSHPRAVSTLRCSREPNNATNCLGEDYKGSTSYKQKGYWQVIKPPLSLDAFPKGRLW
nr:unnamed protein product [Callosobruchus chinensis]